MLPFMTQPAVAPACFRPDYKIAQSQVFKGAQHLARAITMTGNRQTFAFRALVTRDAPGTAQTLYNVDHFPHGPCSHFLIDTDDRLWVRHTDGDGNVYDIKTLAVFRSPGVYDVLIIVNTAAETPSDSLQTWVNGIRITAFTSANYPNPNWGGGLPNYAGGVDLLGVYRSGGSYYYYAKGAFADVVWLDGTIPAVTDFGSFNIHGVWVPKRPAFTLAQYGVNGWFLDFSDPLNPGKDVSGRGNHFTAVGFDAAGNDTVVSTPANRYASLSPLWRVTVGNGTTPTVAGGGLEATIPPVNSGVRADLAVKAGKWYWYGRFTTLPNYCLFGVTRGGASSIWNFEGVHYDNHLGAVYVDGVQVATWATWGSADTIAVALDLDAGTAIFYKNGVLQGTVTLPTSDTGWAPLFSVSNSTTSAYVVANFGQRDWGAYPPPAGFLPLCTDNLPEPDVKDPAEAFTQATATGAKMVAVLDAGSAHWNGQWVEIVKRCDAPEDWRLRFSDDPANAWATNTADAKAAAPALAEGGAYVGYRLRVGKRYGVWTAEVAHVTGTATTVTHNLATVRNAVIATRVGAGGGDRYFRHPDMTAGDLAKLNTNGAAAADGTITGFGVDSFQIAASAPSGTYRVVVLAQRDGYLDIGTYTGTGTAGDGGPFLSTTTRPEWMLAKSAAASTGWMLLDAARSPANPVTSLLALSMPDAPGVFGTGYQTDFVVGGAKVRADSTLKAMNGAGASIYTITIGRPVGGVCVAPATAR